MRTTENLRQGFLLNLVVYTWCASQLLYPACAAADEAEPDADLFAGAGISIMSVQTAVGGDFNDSMVFTTDSYSVDIPRVDLSQGWGLNLRYIGTDDYGFLESGGELGLTLSTGRAPGILAAQKGHPDGYPAVHWNIYYDFKLELCTLTLDFKHLRVGIFGRGGVGYEDLTIKSSGFSGEEALPVEYGTVCFRYGLGIHVRAEIYSIPLSIELYQTNMIGNFESLKVGGDTVKLPEESHLNPGVESLILSIGILGIKPGFK